ncbi:hypothetical protein GSI_01424 [Ganoderma sinense ZZ0214-1]|uniref:Arrestin-like N-terminal domain-containing protein n=1 Tax=Ganoderma sinense ZZ0214-1 TaxID=1077348 RepID=A0A2G8SVF3_9APHY|nr:hypothetical protein GSI_01424 [Ganoderma sinense ZZ0214-1]
MTSNPAAASSLLPRILHPFSLVIPPTTYCPGSDVHGEVLLEFPKIQDEQIDEVVVELRGTLKMATSDSSDRVSPQPQALLGVKTSVWKRGSTYPPSDSHILRVPFRFHLPSDPRILPSVHWTEWHDFVSIVYYVEATALRPTTLFGSEKKIREQLVVVPRGDPSLCTSIRSLGNLEGGPMWKTAHKEQQMRRGISFWTLQLLVPNEHGILPHCIDIPLLIRIKTTTARLPRVKADRHLQDKPIFPAIAIAANTPISITIRQNFAVRAIGASCDLTNKFTLACIKEQDLPRSSYHKHWEDDTRRGDAREMGRWVQHWTFEPKVKFNRFPPTFSSEFVDCAYTVSVQVPFPGVGNNVKVSIPITLDSGIDRATPRRSGGGPAASALEDAPTQTSFGAEAGVGADPSPGGTEIPCDEQPPSRLPTYFEAVYSDNRERDGSARPG